jgi:hypothetical protein
MPVTNSGTTNTIIQIPTQSVTNSNITALDVEWTESNNSITVPDGTIYKTFTLDIPQEVITSAWELVNSTQTYVQETFASSYTYNWSPAKLGPEQRKIEIIRRRRQVSIDEKANALLRSILTDEEWREYRQYGSVRILGSLGGAYEVGQGRLPGGRGWEGSLYKLAPDGSAEQKLCIHAPLEYPVGDRMVALILTLRTNEQWVLDEANVHPLTPHEQQKVKLRRVFLDAA